MARIICCGYLVVFFLVCYALLHQYQRMLTDFVRLRYAVLIDPEVTLRKFCDTPPVAQVSALQCRHSIATRQQEDVCSVVTSISYQTRRYYYLQLECLLQNKFMRVPLPPLHFVVYA